MSTSEKNEIKKEFQLERITFFSDAVFAIIITIMVLDVKLPEITQQADGNVFILILPKLTAYSFSFFIISTFWMRHLRIFSFLKDYDMRLVTINLFFLFSVSLFPFALSFVFDSKHLVRHVLGLYVYSGIFFLAFLSQTLLIGYLVVNNEKLCVKDNNIETLLKWKTRRVNLLAFPVFIIGLVIVGYYNLSEYIMLVTVMAYTVLMRIMDAHYYPRSKTTSPLSPTS
jgi:uncharacterized membrane protein